MLKFYIEFYSSKLCRNCVVTQNFHILKLSKITVFYSVIVLKETFYDFCSDRNINYPSNLWKSFIFFILILKLIDSEIQIQSVLTDITDIYFRSKDTLSSYGIFRSFFGFSTLPLAPFLSIYHFVRIKISENTVLY